MDGKMNIKGDEQLVYEGGWLNVSTVPVENPDGRAFDHHLVRVGAGGAGVLAFDKDKGVLMIWRHRIIGDGWGWELPGGRIEDDDRDPKAAAAREFQEETGWKATELQDLITYQPANGFADHPYYFYFSRAVEWVGPAPDRNEVADIAWIPVAKLPELISKGELTDGFSLTPLLFALAMGPLHDALHAH